MHHSVYVIRHGDRYDFNVGDDAWEALELPRPLDPVLSDLGIKQSTELGAYFASLPSAEKSRIKEVYSSPFVRCIQTCNPIAGACDTTLKIDHSLFEIRHTATEMPSLIERRHYFPRIDLDYESCFIPVPDEDYPEGALERYGAAGFAILEKAFKQSDQNKAIVICTHAAGVVGIVSALLNCTLDKVPSAAPGGIFRVDRTSDNKWKLHPSYQCKVDHISDMGLTIPWPKVTDDGTDYKGWSKMIVDYSYNASWITKNGSAEVQYFEETTTTEK